MFRKSKRGKSIRGGPDTSVVNARVFSSAAGFRRREFFTPRCVLFSLLRSQHVSFWPGCRNIAIPGYASVSSGCTYHRVSVTELAFAVHRVDTAETTGYHTIDCESASFDARQMTCCSINGLHRSKAHFARGMGVARCHWRTQAMILGEGAEMARSHARPLVLASSCKLRRGSLYERR